MQKKSIKSDIKTSILNNDSHIGVISGKSRVLWGSVSSDEDLSSKYISKSNRSDYGRVVDIRIPHGYHEQCKKAWEMYETDPLFRYLIRRCVDFAANGFEWEVPSEKKVNYWDWLKQKVFKTQTKQDKEQVFWDTFSAKINRNVANIIPGIDEINKWFVKNMLLNAMVVPEWEWGRISVDGVDYEVPTKLVTHNVLSIILDRSYNNFAQEEMYLKISSGNQKISETNKQTTVGLGTQPIYNSKDYHKISLMGTEKKPKLEGFAIKYDWSPSDNTALVYGRNVNVGQGLYPSPPFLGLYEVLTMRRALTAADIAILDGIINFILDWEIGDNTKISNNGKESLPNQPRPAKYNSAGTKIEKSTIEMAKEMITSDTRGNVMQLFHPYYIKLNIKMPDTAVLLNTTKYVQSTVEIYQAFGILLAPSDKRLDFTGINIQNFEQMLESIRQMYIKRFWEALASEIVDRNKDKLTVIPNMIFKPLNTKTEAFKQSLLNLMKFGKISTRSLLQGHGLDDRVEINRIASEIVTGEKDLTDRNVPVSFVQSSKKDKNTNKIDNGSEGIEEETSTITPLEQTGRPRGSKKGK